MRRLLTVLVLLMLSSAAGPLLATASGAASTLTVEVSASEVTAGEQIRFTGSSVSRPGSVVRLQRLKSRGWTTLESTKTSPRRTYSFETTPPTGAERYRVVRPAQDGQPRQVSDVVTVSVHWRPEVVVRTRAVHDELGRSVLRLRAVTHADVAALLLQRRATTAAPWATIDTLAATDGVARTVVRDLLSAQFRLVAPASGLLLRSVSTVVSNQHAPYELQFDEPLALPGLFLEKQAATVKIRLHEELPVTLLGTAEDGTAWNATVRGPRGRVVGSFSRDAGERLLRLESPRTGWYTIEVEQLAGEEWTLWALPNPVSETSIDGPPVPFEKTDWYPPFVYGLLQGKAGQVVTVVQDPNRGPDAGVLAPDGNHVQPWAMYAFPLPVDGDYLAVMDPTTDAVTMQVLEATMVQLPTDGSPATFEIDRAHRSVIAEVHATPGHRVTVHQESVEPAGTHHLLMAFDHHGWLGDDGYPFRVPTGGVYWVAATMDRPGTVTVRQEIAEQH